MVRFALLTAGCVLAACVGDDGVAPPDDDSVDTTPANLAPTAPIVVVGPAGAHTGDILQLTLATPSLDPEGQTLIYEVRWVLDGAAVADLDDTWEVPAERVARGQQWDTSVVAVDPSGLRSTPGASAVVIADAPPGAATIHVDPPLPLPLAQDLHCIIDEPATDADADEVTHSIAWMLDGDPYPATPAADGVPWVGPLDGSRPGDTVPAADTRPLQHWTCEVVASALGLAGPAVRAEVFVAAEGPAPDFTLPDVNPNSPRFGQEVSPRDYLEQVSGWYFGHAT